VLRRRRIAGICDREPWAPEPGVTDSGAAGGGPDGGVDGGVAGGGGGGVLGSMTAPDVVNVGGLRGLKGSEEQRNCRDQRLRPTSRTASFGPSHRALTDESYGTFNAGNRWLMTSNARLIQQTEPAD
jgi:hypothetical protein